MPAKTDLDKLLDLVQHINHHEGAAAALSTFAEGVLAALHGCLPTARMVRLYQVEGDSAAVLAATVPGVDRLKLNTDQVYRRAIEQGGPQQDPTTGIWAVPIIRDEAALGLLELGFPQDVPAPPNVPDWLQLMAAALAGPFDRLLNPAPAHIPSDPIQDRLRTLTILNDQAMLLSSTVDEQVLLEDSCRAMVQALHVDHCGIMLLDRSGRFGHVVADYPSRDLIGSVFDMHTNPLYAEVWRRVEPIFVEDVANDPRIDDAGRKVMLGGGVESMLLLPLLDSQGQLFGSFGIDNYNRHRSFTDEQMGIARTLAAQMMIGLQNIRLLRDSQRQAAQLARVNRLGQQLQTEVEMDGVLNAVLTASPDILPLDRLHIALHAPTDNTLRTAALYVYGEGYLTLDNGVRLSPADSFAGQVWQAGEVIHIADTAAAQGAADDLPEMRSLAGVVLVAGSDTLGTLSIGHHDAYIYTANDLAVLQQLAGLLATAVRQAQRSEMSRRQARTEALINDISTRLQQQADVRSMLQVTAEQLGQVLGARKAHIHLSPPSGDEE